MSTVLKRFTTPVTRPWLYRLVSNPDALASESVNAEADLRAVDEVVEKLLEKCSTGTLPSNRRSQWDQEMVEPLYQALQHLPRRLLVDMHFWQWLGVARLQAFVWCRWQGYVPDEPAMVLRQNAGLVERFTGSSSLSGFSRNALTRLFWCAKTLYSEEEEFHWVHLALMNQDLYQAIFERQFGLYPPAVRACLTELKDCSEIERRAATRRLNHHLTTIALETLTEQDIQELLNR